MRSSGVLQIMMIVLALFVLTGCDRNNPDPSTWKFSGRDKNRGIDHYYDKNSVSRPAKDIVLVRTKGVPHKDKKAVETATNVKNAHSFEVKFEMNCAENYIRVLSKEYLDEKGTSLLKENDENKSDSVRLIDPAMPLYGSFKDLCK